jgi:Ala-tRNA(Pro) deacylase
MLYGRILAECMISAKGCAVMETDEADRYPLYARLIALLEAHGAVYRLIDHAPEGRTEFVSPLRGNRLSQAAKCLVLMVKVGKKVTRYVLAVVPGDAKVDVQAVRALLGGTYATFASADVAERLAGSVTGTILPFSFDPELELMVDPAVLEHEELFFNAARLDRSMALRTRDYVALARPRVERIAADGA